MALCQHQTLFTHVFFFSLVATLNFFFADLFNAKKNLLTYKTCKIKLFFHFIVFTVAVIVDCFDTIHKKKLTAAIRLSNVTSTKCRSGFLVKVIFVI